MINLFKRDESYPKWDPDKPKETPGIPDWKPNFGEIEISFEKGMRTCYYSEKHYNRKIDCGDYMIKVTYNIKNWQEKTIDDKEAWKWLVDCLDSSDVDRFINNLYDILVMEIEENVYNFLTEVNFTDNSDELRTLLYYFWHRAIVEDRIYPRKKGFAGRKQIIGPTFKILKAIKNKSNKENLFKDCIRLYNKTKKQCPECKKWYDELMKQ